MFEQSRREFLRTTRALGERQIRIYYPSPCPLPRYPAARAGERGHLNLPLA